MLSVGVRLFIGVIFFVLGASFLATTIALIQEFGSDGWLTLASFYSHLFLFFPTFGIVTLVAFYTPACVFLDLYWRHVPFGRIRFSIGFIVLALLSWATAIEMRASPERSVWEIKPAVLAADPGDPTGCASRPNTPDGTCARMPILSAIQNVRAVSQRRIGLSDLERDCLPDPYVASPALTGRTRFCFASTPLSDPARLTGDAECCRAQKAMVAAVNQMHVPTENRSVTGFVHAWLLPFKVFFMLMLLVISVLLAVRRTSIERHYPHFLLGIERGVLVGAAAMIIYPIMSHAFLQSAALLYGTGGSGSGLGYRVVAPFFSLAFGGWGLLLLFFFYRRRDKELQALGRMGGVIGGAFAVLKYDQIIDWSVRMFGSGASIYNVLFLAAAAVLALVILFWRTAADMGDEATPKRSRKAS